MSGKVLKAILPIIADHTEMRRGIVTILEKYTGAVILDEAYGFLPQARSKVRSHPGKGITDAVIETGLPAIIPRLSKRPLFLDRAGSNGHPDKANLAFLCVPIKIGKEVMGALAVDRLFPEEVPFAEDLRLLAIIAAGIAHAVHLRQEAEEKIENLRAENQRLQKELAIKYSPENLIGNSKTMRNVYDYIDAAGRYNVTVLISGESGVGKERVAKAIHYQGNRAPASFIKVSCTDLPKTLFESTLFGHEKGALPGATALRKGHMELADRGTIFFDEIGELAPVLQANLLRFLKKREFERTGGNKTIKVDVRVIAATSQNLEARIREGKFSEDLFYQVNIFPIIVPPLRERKPDIILLADYFIEKYAQKLGKKVTGISPAALEMLVNYRWPGNVRELGNCVERAIIVSTDHLIHRHHLPPSLHGSVCRHFEKVGR